MVISTVIEKLLPTFCEISSSNQLLRILSDLKEAGSEQEAMQKLLEDEAILELLTDTCFLVSASASEDDADETKTLRDLLDKHFAYLLE